MTRPALPQSFDLYALRVEWRRFTRQRRMARASLPTERIARRA